MFSDENFMQRCLDLAILGQRAVYPNPMVGCVLVHEQKIIGEGYHNQYGGPHAEVEAINSVQDKQVIKEATIYVSLEPCSHFGKTPPCSDLLIEHRPKRVVIASKDPNPLVAGKGIQKLKEAGIEVTSGILEENAKDINKRFYTFHEKKRPYIILKWAQTQDGFIDKERTSKDEAKINWISSPESKTLVHQWRSEEHAILVGKNTVIHDNPSLTVREISGINPIRIVLANELALNPQLNIFSNEAKTIVLNSNEDKKSETIHFIKSDLTIKSILNQVYEQQICSILVEGGAKTIQQFIDANLWDEARIIVGNCHFGSGLKAPILAKAPSNMTNFFNDKLIFYYNDISIT